MKILSLSEENVKRLSAVEMTLDDKGNLVIVAGNNEQGKSSLLDGIEMALHGGASIPAKPVRRGQDKATVEMTLGEIGLPELTVKRTMTSTGGGALTVTNKDGAKLSSPQAILDALVGKLSFDPLGFVKMKADDRTKTLQQLMGLDFKALDLDRARLFAERTEVNRTVKAKQAQLAAIPRQEAPAEEQSLDNLMAEQDAATKANEANAEARRRAAAMEATARGQAAAASTMQKQCKDVEQEIERLQQKLASYVAAFDKATADAEATFNTAKAMQEEAAKLVDQDLSQFKAKMFEIQTINRKVQQNKERQKIADELKVAEKWADKLTKQIDAGDREKRDKIAGSKFPLPGMSLGDSGEVLLDGLPFEQASTKGQLMASLAMGAALNPKLRVLLVRSGNDLDDSALKVLAEWADSNNIQVWLEKIHGGDKAAIVIEDGHAVTT